MDDAVKLSGDFPWTIIKVNGHYESNDIEQEVELVAQTPKILLFHGMMKRVFLHHLLLKEQMKDCTVNYVDLLCSNSIPTRHKKD